ncbi:MAG TPA: ribulose-phosphate 3-epimerase [Firmicutes bacterium]|jgi:ribulose-phosphate 3-epimerase|nr:ribulose-phosphate 3-epimerase [Bacillota bacterium]
MIKIAPSIFAGDFSILGQQVAELEKAGVDYVHVDIMDGHFVKLLSFGSKVIRDIKKCTSLILDVHLMIEKPERCIEEFLESGADIITIHFESTLQHKWLLNEIRGAGVKTGIALNPTTPLNVLDYLYDDIDMVSIMTSNPGLNGQSFLPGMLNKINDLQMKIIELKRPIDIEVDGSINEENIKEVIRVGANVIVIGRAFFTAMDKPGMVYNLKRMK